MTLDEAIKHCEAYNQGYEQGHKQGYEAGYEIAISKADMLDMVLLDNKEGDGK